MSAELLAALEAERHDLPALERERGRPRLAPPARVRPVCGPPPPPISPEQGRANRLALLEALVGIAYDGEIPRAMRRSPARWSA